MKTEPIRIAITGGASGGHLFPLISVTKAIKKEAEQKNWNIEIFYVGAPVFKKEILEEENISYYPLASSKIRRYFDPRNLIDILKFPLGIFQALKILYKFMPDAIFSKGGPGSLQVVFASWLLKIPILIHESDSIPGRTNLKSARFATKIAVSFEQAKKYFPKNKTALIGNPIDPDFDRLEPTNGDYENLKLDKDRKIILIQGGSQGAQKINDVIIESVPQILKMAQVVHQVGEKNFQETRLTAEGFILEETPTKKSDYHAYGFIPHNNLIIIMKMADLIISRAGGGAIFEIAAAGKPSILVPLPEEVAGRHQIENAYEYANTGACSVIEQPNFTTHILNSVIKKILEDNETQKSMSESAKQFAKPQAAQMIAKEIIYLITKE
ncbi:MAG: UDP-N-acetylglucosamine--N-acetylmuramyl-(pentapeptide) pyrophosphoryl-undecaprenol N-acetylglucosamine transferase [Patescibacteria group bacterium]